jgi:hypothetical protein
MRMLLYPPSKEGNPFVDIISVAVLVTLQGTGLMKNCKLR